MLVPRRFHGVSSISAVPLSGTTSRKPKEPHLFIKKRKKTYFSCPNVLRQLSRTYCPYRWNRDTVFGQLLAKEKKELSVHPQGALVGVLSPDLAGWLRCRTFPGEICAVWLVAQSWGPGTPSWRLPWGAGLPGAAQSAGQTIWTSQLNSRTKSLG